MVPQDDVLLSTSTVEEAVLFSAAMRLPAHYSLQALNFIFYFFLSNASARALLAPGTQFTCFTRTKEQILTQKLVQMYEY
jgi:hypothetical protein